MHHSLVEDDTREAISVAPKQVHAACMFLLGEKYGEMSGLVETALCGRQRDKLEVPF